MNPRGDYSKALKLRLQGKSYGEIRNIFGIPKSTQSGWFKKLKLPEKARRILDTKQKESLLALGKFNKRRTKAIKEENEEIRKRFQNQVGILTERELTFIGASLYWAEGQKYFSTKNGGYPLINFSNSDPYMITIFSIFLRRILKIDESKLTGCIIVHPGISEKEALRYWSKTSGIKKIRCYVALSRASQKKRPSNLLPYGTFQIRLYSRREFFKIRGLIDGITKNLIG